MVTKHFCASVCFELVEVPPVVKDGNASRSIEGGGGVGKQRMLNNDDEFEHQQEERGERKHTVRQVQKTSNLADRRAGSDGESLL